MGNSPRVTIGDAVANQPGFRALTRVERVLERPDRGYIEQPNERVEPAPVAEERKRRKVITDEKVKMAAAERVLIGGVKRTEVAASLDVSPSAISLWIEEYRKKAANGEVTPASRGGEVRPLPKLEIRFDGVRIDGLEEYIEALVDARVEARVSAAVRLELRKRLAGD